MYLHLQNNFFKYVKFVSINYCFSFRLYIFKLNLLFFNLGLLFANIASFSSSRLILRLFPKSLQGSYSLHPVRPWFAKKMFSKKKKNAYLKNSIYSVRHWFTIKTNELRNKFSIFCVIGYWQTTGDDNL
jgi:hypothetical protein